MEWTTENPGHRNRATDGEIVVSAQHLVAAADQRQGEFVVVARTPSGEYRAFGGENSALRAAVSVAVAAGNTRFWHDVTGQDTIEVGLRSLPEVVATAAEASGVTRIHLGCVIDESLVALAIWFEIAGPIADATERRHAMDRLAAAAEIMRHRVTQEALDAVARQPVAEPSSTGASTTATLNLTTRSDFMDALDEYDHDEVTLVLVDVDDLSDHRAAGDAAASAVDLHVGTRLGESIRANDLVARISEGCYAVLFDDPTRSIGMQVAKRLCEAIAAKVDTADGERSVTATVAIAHQYGLVDTEELLEAADAAVHSGRRQGPGRLVIASA